MSCGVYQWCRGILFFSLRSVANKKRLGFKPSRIGAGVVDSKNVEDLSEFCLCFGLQSTIVVEYVVSGDDFSAAVASAFFVVVDNKLVFEDGVEVCGAAFAGDSQKLNLCAVQFAFAFFFAFFKTFLVSFLVAFVIPVFVGYTSGFVGFVFQCGVWPPFSLIILFDTRLIRHY